MGAKERYEKRIQQGVTALHWQYFSGKWDSGYISDNRCPNKGGSPWMLNYVCAGSDGRYWLPPSRRRSHRKIRLENRYSAPAHCDFMGMNACKWMGCSIEGAILQENMCVYGGLVSDLKSNPCIRQFDETFRCALDVYGLERCNGVHADTFRNEYVRKYITETVTDPIKELFTPAAPGHSKKAI